jgi:hypothetical protein
MTLKVDGTNGLLQQYDYQVSTTGFSYTFAAGTTVLVMNPAGTLATGTITMPAAPVDGMTISFSSTQIITALTVNGNTGQSIVGAPTSLTAGSAATFVYRLSNTTWYNQLNTVQTATGATGVPVLNVYTSSSTWTKPASVKAIKVTVVGGGGPGGSNYQPTGNSGGGGGGGGTAIRTYPAPSLPGPQPYTVGGASSTSSFGVAPITVISATGGSGGGSGNSGPGGAGGIGTNGQANMAGSAGVAYGTGTGVGGSSFMGGGGGTAPINGNAPGNPGGAYGGGGGGGGPGTGGSYPGGSGAAGVVIVEEFY